MFNFKNSIIIKLFNIMDLRWMKPLLPFFVMMLTLAFPKWFQYMFGICFVIYWSPPVLFQLSAAFRRLFVFANHSKSLGEAAYDGETNRFWGALRNFKLFLDPDQNSYLGIWHILPIEYTYRELAEERWEIYLRESHNPIFIYLHGNSGSRSAPVRKQLYSLFQRMNFHVIAFDYRGYGDSSYATPTEKGLVSDAKAVFNYVRDIIGEDVKNRVFLWGHSLGTAVTCHAAAELCQEGKHPAGIILEAPFTNIKDAVRYYHLTLLFYQDVPVFDYIFVRPLHNSGIRFESNRHISRISVPIIILHAVDDVILPFHMGQKLYQTALKTRLPSYGPVYFKEFGKGYGHLFIVHAPELPEIIRTFVISSISDTPLNCNSPSIAHTNTSNDYNNNPCT